MKHLFTCSLMAMLLVIGTSNLMAQTTANFNSTSSTDVSQVKAIMQNNCWQLPGMDVNGNGWAASIEGDGALVSGTSANNSKTCGIYTPMLKVTGNVTVSFKYKFNSNTSSGRWFKIYLTDDNNTNVVMLDSVEISGKTDHDIYTYNKSFNTLTGSYKLYINYQSSGSTIRVAIDELWVSSNKLYTNGCNQAPTAVNDIFTGNVAGITTGNVKSNDSDPDNEDISTSLVGNSPDGIVELQSNGDFTFKASPDFNGNSTTFNYMACDNGHNPLCTQATATINFQSRALLPASLIDFLALARKENVILNWTTTFEVNNDRFEILRSTDGQSFKTVGTVKSNGNSQQNVLYAFTDNIRNINTDKKDLYYRLRQIDKDGKESLSKILIVRVYNTKVLQIVSVTPNPVINNIKVNVDLNETAMVSMKITNINGTEIMHKAVKGTTGSNTFELEGTQALKSGIYFLEVIINSKERMDLKLIKN